MEKFYSMFEALLPGIAALFIAGFIVIAILLEITWKKACDSIAEKTKRDYTALKTGGSLVLAVLMSTYAGFGAVADGLLPGGVLLTALWVGLVFVFQFFGSLYAIKGVKLLIEYIKKKLSAKEERVYTEKETRKFRIREDGTKEYLT